MLFWNRVFWKSFGTYCVMWNFGSGKTSWTFNELSKYDKKKTSIPGKPRMLIVHKSQKNNTETLSDTDNSTIAISSSISRENWKVVNFILKP